MEINSPVAEKWLKCSSNNLHQKFWSTQWEDYYKKKLKDYKGQMKELIEKDVDRSCYGLTNYPRQQKQMRNELKNVLCAYCVYDPELGYTQGMSFIVERLLSHLSDYQAYIVWLGILKTDNFRNYYTNDFGTNIKQNFSETIQELTTNLPKISKHIHTIVNLSKSVGSKIIADTDDPMFIFYNLFTQISMTLGCILPISNIEKDQIITEFLLERNKNRTITTVLLGVLSVMQSVLLKTKTPEDIYMLLSSESLVMHLKDRTVFKEGHIVRERLTLSAPDTNCMDSDEFWIV